MTPLVFGSSRCGAKPDPRIHPLRSRTFNRTQRDMLRERLENMNPFAFEQLICDLLTEMGYEDVEVTQPTNDKGVDVKAVAQFGITTINEVIQVKRHRANIQRPVLDMLRGSLHRFKAQKGTIITTGDFGKGAKDAAFEMGAAPITLINGDTLIDLLIQHGIGVKKKPWSISRLRKECSRRCRKKKQRHRGAGIRERRGVTMMGG